MEQFYTADKAAEGIKLPLYEPNGTMTDYWLKVIGIDSEKFRVAEALCKGKTVEIAALDISAEDKARKLIEMERDLTATLVIDWNLEQEFSHDNVVKFLQRAPQIQKEVDRQAANRRLFFKKK